MVCRAEIWDWKHNGNWLLAVLISTENPPSWDEHAGLEQEGTNHFALPTVIIKGKGTEQVSNSINENSVLMGKAEILIFQNDN